MIRYPPCKGGVRQAEYLAGLDYRIGQTWIGSFTNPTSSVDNLIFLYCLHSKVETVILNISNGCSNVKNGNATSEIHE